MWLQMDVTDGDGYGVPDEHKNEFEIYLTADLLAAKVQISQFGYGDVECKELKNQDGYGDSQCKELKDQDEYQERTNVLQEI
jgi:hypothetical protein